MPLTGLRSAVFRGDLEAVRTILTNTSISEHQEEVNYFFGVAVENSHFEIASLLLDYGANMEVHPRLLQDAVIEGHANMIQMLLDHGLRAQMYECLQATIRQNRSDLTRLLMPYTEGNITAQQRTNLLLIAHHSHERNDIYVYLRTTWPSASMEYNRQTLINAVRENDYNLIDVLIHVLEMDIHANDEELLRLATLLESIDMVTTLLRYGADVHAQNEAALRIAYAALNNDLVEILLAGGANPQGIIPEDELQGFMQEAQVVDFADYTAPVEHTSLSSDSAYHGFFTAFCEHSGRLNNRIALSRFRQIIINAANRNPPLIENFGASDLRIIRTGTQRQLCQWMQRRQNERSNVCKSDGQYDVEPFTQEPVNTIPLLFLWIHRGNTCFDLISLSRYIESNNLHNPLNRQPFTEEEIQSIRGRAQLVFELMRTVFEMIPA